MTKPPADMDALKARPSELIARNPELLGEIGVEKIAGEEVIEG